MLILYTLAQQILSARFCKSWKVMLYEGLMVDSMGSLKRYVSH
jgi:hypothetical protein